MVDGEKIMLSAPIPSNALRHLKLNGFVFDDLVFFIIVSSLNDELTFKRVRQKKQKLTPRLLPGC